MQQNDRRPVVGAGFNVSDVERSGIDLLQGLKRTSPLGLRQLDGSVEDRARVGNLNWHQLRRR